MFVESIEKESVKFGSILFSIEVVNFDELNYFINSTEVRYTYEYSSNQLTQYRNIFQSLSLAL